MTARAPAQGPSEQPLPTPRPEVRAKVKDLLSQSAAFRQLDPVRQQQVARDTALVADTLVGRGSPEMTSVGARAMAGETDYEKAQEAVDAIGQQPFTAGAAHEGAAIAGEFLKQINFVEFVSGLIDGVFNSIVTSSIQQMEAYSKMVADVAKSLNQFRDENTTEDEGKDALVDEFPDVFNIGMDQFSGSDQPTLMLRDGVDEDSALARVQQTLGSYSDGGINSIDVSDADAQARLITAARSHIATGRQQLLATMVLLGLNRIVVTDGKIAAKIMYDFNASTQRTLSRTAQARDYARDASGNLALLTDREGEYDRGGTSSGDYSSESGNYSGNYDSDYYTKGKYKYAQKPVMTAVSMASDAQVDQLNVRANLMGQVEVNFRSDFMPLDKVATPEMMAAIQMRSKPVDHNKPVYKATEAQAPQAQQSA